MAKLETNIITPKRNTGKNADIIEDLEIMAQSIQDEFNKKADNSITEDFDKKLGNKVDKEEGKDLSTNDFTNLLKEKLENLENYNDTEIRNLLNGSLKGVNYTASNGMLTFTKNDGSTISVDLPLELLIESGRYDEANKQIVLVLANGNSINIPVSSLLDDFYGKNETYNKTEVDTIIAEKQALIDKLEEENQKQQEELDILNSEYTEKELEGESVVISNGLPKSKIKVKGNGNSYQETTEGYQLLDFSKYKSISNYTTYSFQNDVATIKSDGGVYQKVEFDILDLFLNNAGKKLYFNRDSYEATGETAGTNQIEYIVNGTKKYVYNTSGYFNIPEDLENVTEATFCVYVNNSGTAKQGSVILTKPRLTLNSNEPYEPYTGGQASPNPNYKQDIEVIDGVNRFDIIKITENNYLNVGNGALGNSTTSNTSDFIPVKANQIYTAKLDYDTLIAEGKRAYCLYDSNKTYLAGTEYTSSNKGFTVTPTQNGYIRFAYDKNCKDIMFYEGTSEKPYLPYGHIGLMQRGKNLIDKNSIGWCKNSTVEYYHIFLGVGTYTISSPDMPVFSQGKNLFFLAGKVTSGGNSSVNGVDKDTPQTITTTDGYVTIGNRYIYNNNDGLYHPEDYSWQIEKGTVATAYEPYIEPIVHSIDLAGNSLAKVGEIADLLNIKANGKVEIEKQINKIIGTELINDNRKFELSTSYSDDTYVCCFYNWLLTYEENSQQRFPMCSPNNKFILCNKLLNGHYVKGKTKEQIGIESSLGITLLRSRCATIEEVNNLIKDEDFEFYYSLAKPTTIELPSIKPIEMIEGITNVFELVTNLGTTLSVTYKVSNKKKILNLEERISALESAVIGG